MPSVFSLTRPKQVTDPLNEIVRARLCNSHCLSESSSGSEHDPDSDSLADMINGFMEEDELQGSIDCDGQNDADGPSLEEDSGNILNGSEIKELLEGLLSSCICKPFEALICREAISVVEVQNLSADKGLLRRSVMSHLRALGYNAGVCKVHWGHVAGFPAGDYEFLDVISQGERFILDLDFKAQFQIARPTGLYNHLFEILPIVFVGRVDKLKQIIKLMSNCAKKSLKKKGMYLPPWRKHRYLQAKWLGPYKRTTNPAHKDSCNRSRSQGLGGLQVLGQDQDQDKKKVLKEPKSRTGNSRPWFENVFGFEGSEDWSPPALLPRPEVKICSALACALKAS